MKTVICRLDLGYTRIAGYLLYDNLSQEFLETTPRDTKELVKKGQVNGLMLVSGEIELDEEGFNQKNLMVRTGVGKYRPLKDTDSLINRMYAVIDVVDCGGEIKYEVITNYCGRKLVDEDFIKSINFMGYVAGVKIADDGIQLCGKIAEVDAIKVREIPEEYNELAETTEAASIPAIEEEIKQAKEIILAGDKSDDAAANSPLPSEEVKEKAELKAKSEKKKSKTKL